MARRLARKEFDEHGDEFEVRDYIRDGHYVSCEMLANAEGMWRRGVSGVRQEEDNVACKMTRMEKTLWKPRG